MEQLCSISYLPLEMTSFSWFSYYMLSHLDQLQVSFENLKCHFQCHGHWHFCNEFICLHHRFFHLINPQTIYLNWRAPVKPNPDQQSFKHGPWPTLNLSSHWVPWAGWPPFKPCLISDEEMIELDTKKRVLPLPIKEKNQINQNTCSLPTIPSLLINFI